MSYNPILISVHNQKLEKDGIASINLPPVLTCPGAGDCKKYCYAQLGHQAMGRAKDKRVRGMELYKENPKEFERLVLEKKYTAVVAAL